MIVVGLVSVEQLMPFDVSCSSFYTESLLRSRDSRRVHADKNLAYKRYRYIYMMTVTSFSLHHFHSPMIFDRSFAERSFVFAKRARKRTDPRRPPVITVAESIKRPVTPLLCTAHPDRKKQQCKPVPKGKNGGPTSNFLMNAAHTVCYRGGGWSLHDYCVYIYTSKQQSKVDHLDRFHLDITFAHIIICNNNWI